MESKNIICTYVCICDSHCMNKMVNFFRQTAHLPQVALLEQPALKYDAVSSMYEGWPTVAMADVHLKGSTVHAYVRVCVHMVCWITSSFNCTHHYSGRLSEDGRRHGEDIWSYYWVCVYMYVPMMAIGNWCTYYVIECNMMLLLCVHMQRMHSW